MVCGRKGDEVGEADEDENEGWEESRGRGLLRTSQCMPLKFL